MLWIRKSASPPILAKLRGKRGWVDVYGDEKAAVLAQLIADQGGVCAYCMRRIESGTDEVGQPTCTVEHWAAQSSGADPFAWADLLAVCNGRLGGKAHCDKARGDQPLSVHPAHPTNNVELRVRYASRDAAIEIADSGDAETLNLNHAILRRSRLAVSAAVLDATRDADATLLRRQLSHWKGLTSDGSRAEYAGVAIYLIERRLGVVEGRGRRLKRTKGQAHGS